MRPLLAIFCCIAIAVSGCAGGTVDSKPEGSPVERAGGGTDNPAAPATARILTAQKTTCDVKLSDVDGKVSNLAVDKAECRVKQVKLDADTAYEDYGALVGTVSWTSLSPTALNVRASLRTPDCGPSNTAACSLATAEGTSSPLKLRLDGDDFKKDAADLYVVLFSDGPTYDQPVKIELALEP